MRIEKMVLALATLIAFSIPSIAMAVAKNREKDKILDSSPFAEVVDKDKDGRMSHDEWIAAGLSEFGFGVMNLNKDNYVTVSEMMDPECDAPPDGIDKNNDGKIQFDEFFVVVGVKDDAGDVHSSGRGGPTQK